MRLWSRQQECQKKEITLVDLEEMPDEWVGKMHKATIQGRAEKVLSLIGKIDGKNFELTHQLSYWVKTFQFDEIVALTIV